MGFRILITGGFGFIGGRLAVHLAQAGHQVVLGSRSDQPRPEWLPEAEVVQTLWNDAESLETICQGVDVVIHAAGMNAADCTADPVAGLEFNGVATARLANAAARAGVKRFVYLSTAHVYASPLEGVITEETCPRNLHPYATSHLAGENAVLYCSRSGNMEGIVLRLSNAFGVPVHQDVNCWMLLVNDLCRQAVEKRSLILRSSGMQYRDFIPLGTVCEMVGELVINETLNVRSSVFNVGSGSSMTVLDMAEIVRDRYGYVFVSELQIYTKDVVGEKKKTHLEYLCSCWDGIGLVGSKNDCYNEIDALLRYCEVIFT